MKLEKYQKQKVLLNQGTLLKNKIFFFSDLIDNKERIEDTNPMNNINNQNSGMIIDWLIELKLHCWIKETVFSLSEMLYFFQGNLLDMEILHDKKNIDKIPGKN